jgi:polyphosphate:AMP phosphotransferase
MLEAGEPTGWTLTRPETESRSDAVARLREALLGAQFDLVSSKRFAVVLLVSGLEGSGRSETVNILREWLDSRHVHMHALGEPSSEERQRPPMWWVWRRLPPRGEIGVFYRAWHFRELLDDPKLTQEARIRRIDEIVRFERMLAAEGVLVLNFYFHLSRKQQKKRLKKLAKDPKSAWRVTKRTWRALESATRSRETRARMLGMLSTPETPWFPVEGANPEDCAIAVGKVILEALTRRLAAKEPPPPPPVSLSQLVLTDDAPAVRLDLSLKLAPREFAPRLAAAQERLALLVLSKRFRKRSLVAVFEGSDAAGKGGAIRRITQALDARLFETIPISAPTDEERAQPYLWRFWRHIPGWGRIAIFDRSWYGRVLVERVEGFCREADWRRAFGEINDFEDQLTAHGAIVIKFWLEISKDEQLARFEARQRTGFKRYKITPDDWRNREKWDQYEAAAAEMFRRTSTDAAPWVLVEANDKRFARVKVVESLCEHLEAQL